MCLTLGGCGGTSTPAPSPTPSPTSTPTPVPTPTPTPITYTPLDALTGDQQFDTVCSSFGPGGNNGNVQRPTHPFGTGPVLQYVESTDSYRALGSDIDLTFGPEDLNPQAPIGIASYGREDSDGLLDLLTLASPPISGGFAQYVRGVFAADANLLTDDVGYGCLYGVPTNPADTLPGQLANRSLYVNGSAIVTDSGGNPFTPSLRESHGTLSFDPATRVVSVTLALGGFSNGDPFGVYTGEAIVAANGVTFDGTLNRTDGLNQASQFSGLFFGPQGSEVGLVFSIDTEDPVTGDRIVASGTAAARLSNASAS